MEWRGWELTVIAVEIILLMGAVITQNNRLFAWSFMGALVVGWILINRIRKNW